MSRVLSIDFGERRIGLAVSDPTRTIASPVATLSRRAGKRPPWADIEKLVAEYEVAEIVVGLPLDLEGDENAWSEEVRTFAAKVAERTDRPVHLLDERMTSVRAERLVRSAGLRKGQREEKWRIDATAAAIILQNYLEADRRSRPAENGTDTGIGEG